MDRVQQRLGHVDSPKALLGTAQEEFCAMPSDASRELRHLQAIPILGLDSGEPISVVFAFPKIPGIS